MPDVPTPDVAADAVVERRDRPVLAAVRPIPGREVVVDEPDVRPVRVGLAPDAASIRTVGTGRSKQVVLDQVVRHRGEVAVHRDCRRATPAFTQEDVVDQRVPGTAVVAYPATMCAGVSGPGGEDVGVADRGVVNDAGGPPDIVDVAVVEGVATLRRVQRDVVLGRTRSIDLHVLERHVCGAGAVSCGQHLDHVGPSAVDEHVPHRHVVMLDGQPSVDGRALDHLPCSRGGERPRGGLRGVPGAGRLWGGPVTIHLRRIRGLRRRFRRRRGLRLRRRRGLRRRFRLRRRRGPSGVQLERLTIHSAVDDRGRIVALAHEAVPATLQLDPFGGIAGEDDAVGSIRIETLDPGVLDQGASRTRIDPNAVVAAVGHRRVLDRDIVGLHGDGALHMQTIDHGSVLGDRDAP